MHAPWFHVRFRAAERALKEGRLDAAYDGATASDLRDDRRGRALLDRLVKPLLARARVHAQAGRYDAALADLDRLEAVNRGEPERTNLRRRVMTERTQRAAERAADENAYRRAAERIDEGRLESGRIAVARVDDDRHREELVEELDARVQRSHELLDQAASALDNGDVLAAHRHWRAACERHGCTQAADTFADRLVPAICDLLRGSFDEGRLERFLSISAAVAPLRERRPADFEECDRLAELTRSAAGQLAGHDYRRLRQTLLRLRAGGSAARWVVDSIEAVEQVRGGQDRLLASPLGLMTPLSTSGMSTPQAANVAGGLHETVAAAIRPVKSVEPLLLLIDGTGSALLLAQNLVRVGRAGGSSLVDVPVPGDLNSHHADIITRGDDFFLMPRGPVRVNSEAIKSALLRDGDRIRLGARAKLEFHKPSAKSETAVLKVADRCRLPMDVSYVVLFRDTCVIGPQPSCHIRTREGESRVVLLMRDGQLYARLAGGGGRPAGPARPLSLGQTEQVGDQSITVTKYTGAEGPDHA